MDTRNVGTRFDRWKGRAMNWVSIAQVLRDHLSRDAVSDGEQIRLMLRNGMGIKESVR